MSGRLLLSGLVLFYLVFRLLLESRFLLFDPDEALEMLAARSLLEGHLPYLGALSNRGPFLTLLHALPLALFGVNNYRAVHGFCVLVFVLVLVLLYRQVARAAGRRAALLSTLGLVLLATVRRASAATWSTDSDMLMAALATAGMALLLGARTRAAQGPEAGTYGLCGLLLSLSFLTKQNGVVFALVPPAFALLCDRRHLGAKLLRFGGAFLAPVLLTFGVYAAAGHFGRFWYFFFQYNHTYIAGTLARACSELPWLYRGYEEFFLLAAAGVAAAWADRRLRADRLWPLYALWAAAGLLAAVLPGRPWDNYLWAAHAPVAVLGGVGAAAWLESVERRLPPALPRFNLAAVLAFLFLFSYQRGLRHLPATRDVGNIKQPLVPRDRLLQIIRAQSGPADSIYVTGYAPEMYVLAERRPASRHTVSNYVEGLYPGRLDVPSVLSPMYLAELTLDLSRSRPRVVLDACRLGFLCYKSSALTDALPALLDREYRPLQPGPPGVYVRKE